MPHSVFIKSMVCNRCKTVVTQLFKDFNLHPLKVNLGEVVLERTLIKAEIPIIEERLKQFGFQLITDNRATITVRIKSLLIDLLEVPNFDLKLKLSEFLSDKLNYEYHYLSNLFSEIEGTTIEKYFILLKVEKIKELIEYGEFNLSEISYKLGYSSPAHLTNQFKNITGYTPTYFKSITGNNRTPLDEL